MDSCVGDTDPGSVQLALLVNTSIAVGAVVVLLVEAVFTRACRLRRGLPPAAHGSAVYGLLMAAPVALLVAGAPAGSELQCQAAEVLALFDPVSFQVIAAAVLPIALLVWSAAAVSAGCGACLPAWMRRSCATPRTLRASLPGGTAWRARDAAVAICCIIGAAGSAGVLGFFQADLIVPTDVSWDATIGSLALASVIFVPTVIYIVAVDIGERIREHAEAAAAAVAAAAGAAAPAAKALGDDAAAPSVAVQVAAVPASDAPGEAPTTPAAPTPAVLSAPDVTADDRHRVAYSINASSDAASLNESLLPQPAGVAAAASPAVVVTAAHLPSPWTVLEWWSTYSLPSMFLNLVTAQAVFWVPMVVGDVLAIRWGVPVAFASLVGWLVALVVIGAAVGGWWWLRLRAAAGVSAAAKAAPVVGKAASPLAAAG